MTGPNMTYKLLACFSRYRVIHGLTKVSLWKNAHSSRSLQLQTDAVKQPSKNDYTKTMKGSDYNSKRNILFFRTTSWYSYCFVSLNYKSFLHLSKFVPLIFFLGGYFILTHIRNKKNIVEIVLMKQFNH